MQTTTDEIAEGIYRIDRDFLLAQGLDAAQIDAIDLEQLRLFNRGQEVAIDIYDQAVRVWPNAWQPMTAPLPVDWLPLILWIPSTMNRI